MRRFAARLLRRLADRVEGCVRNRHPGGVAACNCRGCRDIKRQLNVRQGEQPDPLAPPPNRGHGSDTTIPSAHVPPPRDSGARSPRDARR